MLGAMMLTDGESKAPPPPPPPVVRTVPTSPTVEAVVGKASFHHGSRGFHGTLHIAMQDGRWTGKVNRYVFISVEGSKFIRVAVVDYCQCFRGTERERIVDLSEDVVRKLGLNTKQGIYDVVVREIP